VNKQLLSAAAVVASLMCGLSFAAGACTGCTIKNIGAGPYYDSICTSGACIFVAMESTVTGRPPCSSNPYWHFVLDVSTASGRATYALLLAAQASDKPLNISGSNSCILSPSGLVENLYFATYAD
jgi:hypothetical protein